jgi:itaconate CoA-transferase
MSTATSPDTASIYHAKLTDPNTAMEAVTSGSSVAIGQAASQPRALLGALAARAGRGEIDRVKLYYFHAETPMADTVLRYELMGRLQPYSMFLQRSERELIKRGEQDGRKVVFFVPTSFSGSVRLFAESIPVDTFIVTVSPMDENGYFTFGTNNDYTSSVARQAKHLIVEVNPNMPRVYGASALHVSEVDALVEDNSELPELPQRPVTDLDRVIGRHVAALVPDRACIQIGVGGLPQAVCEELRDRADLGIHSEVFTPALADLVRRGVATGRYKAINRGKAVFTFAMGDRAMYRFMNDNLALESHPVNYINDPAVIAQNDNMISVNSTVEMDLTGACNSDNWTSFAARTPHPAANR